MAGKLVSFRALYDFDAEDDGELSVVKGDLVTANPGSDGEWGTEDDIKVSGMH